MVERHHRALVRLCPMVLLCLLLAALPFNWAWSGTWSVGRGSMRVSLVELLSLATIGAWSVAAATGHRHRIPSGRVLLAMVALVILACAASFVAGPEVRNRALPWVARLLLALCLFIVAFDVAATPSHVRSALLALLLGAAVSAVIGAALLIDGSPDGWFGVSRLLTIGGTPRAGGTWGHPNVAGQAWSIALLTGLALVLQETRRLPRLVVASGVILVAAGLVLTYSRGALLGTVAGLIVLAIIGLRGTGRRLAPYAAITVGLVLGGLFLAYPPGSVQLARVTSDSDRMLYGAEYAVVGRIRADPGATVEVEVVARNLGGMTWRPDGAPEVRLVGYWFKPSPTGPLNEVAAGAALPATVDPGETVTVIVPVQAPGLPGRYRIAWDLDHVGVRGFSERGVRTPITELIVAEGGGRSPQDPALARTIDPYPDAAVDVPRIDRWRAAAAIVAEHPVLGIGPGAFGAVFGRYLGLEHWDQRSHAHDLYLELAVGTGLVGLAGFLILVALALRPLVANLLGRSGAAGPEDLLRAGLLAAALSVLVHGVVDYLFHATAIMVLFWVVLGLGHGLARPHERPGGPDTPAPPMV